MMHISVMVSRLYKSIGIYVGDLYYFSTGLLLLHLFPMVNKGLNIALKLTIKFCALGVSPVVYSTTTNRGRQLAFVVYEDHCLYVAFTQYILQFLCCSKSTLPFLQQESCHLQ